MTFTSPLFLWAFLPAALAVHAAAPRSARGPLLLLAGFLFYAAAEPRHLWLLPAACVVNFLFGLRVTGEYGNAYLVVGVFLNLLTLALFKVPGAATPAGVSFLAFEGVAYLVDVARGHCRAERRPTRLGLYFAFFPHLVAGPIVRYRRVRAALGRVRPSGDDVAVGVRRFAVGLAKKMLLATLLAVPADAAFALPAGTRSMSAAWLGLVCYSLQLYLDFSGYCDMAVGLGRLWGVKLPENFHTPYAADSVRDFWRRWHVTLGLWLRDYVYHPLGGGRSGPRRRTFNLLVVFTLCGLWHGVGWTFLVWGLWHGAWVAVEHAGWRAGGRLRTLAVVALGWVPFRASSLTAAGGYLLDLVGAGSGVSAADLMTRELLLVLPAAVLASGAWPAREVPGMRTRTVGLAVAFAAAALFAMAGGDAPFIYFRF